LSNYEQVCSKMTVKGVKNFEVNRRVYPHPYGIIGCGYNGIKTAMYLERDGQTNYVMFDRYTTPGGHAWLEAANKTTRIRRSLRPTIPGLVLGGHMGLTG